MSLEMQVIKDRDVNILKCRGSVDVLNYREVEKVIKEFIDADEFKVIVDLSDAVRVSSVAWDLFVMFHYMCRKKRGDLKLTNLGHETKTVFDLLELDSVLHTYSSVNDARQSFDGYTGRAV